MTRRLCDHPFRSVPRLVVFFLRTSRYALPYRLEYAEAFRFFFGFADEVEPPPPKILATSRARFSTIVGATIAAAGLA